MEKIPKKIINVLGSFNNFVDKKGTGGQQKVHACPSRVVSGCPSGQKFEKKV